MDFIGGLFNTDNLGQKIVDGITSIGGKITDAVTAPFKAAYDYVGNKASEIMNMLPDTPSWLGGDDKSNEASPKVIQVNDAEIDPSGGLVVSGAKGTYQLNQKDSIVAGTNLDATPSGAPGGGNLLSSLGQIATAPAAPAAQQTAAPAAQGSLTEVAGLLKQLIAATSQPVKINIGGRVIDEIEKQTTLRKTYNTKVDSGYGTHG